MHKPWSVHTQTRTYRAGIRAYIKPGPTVSHKRINTAYRNLNFDCPGFGPLPISHYKSQTETKAVTQPGRRQTSQQFWIIISAIETPQISSLLVKVEPGRLITVCMLLLFLISGSKEIQLHNNAQKSKLWYLTRVTCHIFLAHTNNAEEDDAYHWV